MEIDVNYGGWGGAVYDWRVMDLRQQYHTTFAGASLGMHSKGFIVWMRGGGFKYHYESEKPANIQVAYSTSELIFDNTNDVYDVYAPAPKTEVNWTNINAHKNDHWDYIKDKDLNAGSSEWQQNGTNISFITGKVGIGTTSPGIGTSPDVNCKLQVNGGVTLSTGQKLALDHNYYVHAYMQFSSSEPLARFKYFGYYGHRWETSSGEHMRLTQGGQVIIGSKLADPDFKLSVDGTIGAKEVKVTLDGGWSDFVFEDNYQLKTLTEVENYIAQNKHLPDVPSAAEVEENGVILGEMDAVLLQKIEELTLYVIDLKKENEEIKKESKEIKEIINNMNN